MPLSPAEFSIASGLKHVRERIAASAVRAGRNPTDVKLVAVTKKQPLEAAELLCQLGQFDLGENLPQEVWRKAELLKGSGPKWHLIGHLQTNKAKRTYPLVNMIHAIDSMKLLKLIDTLALNMTQPPAVCLQVNCSAEPSKHGWSPEQIRRDAEVIAACRSAPIVGLMTMAALGERPEAARPAFALLRETREDLRERTDLPLLELSMGMSNDYEIAIEEGATWIRVGSALFEGTGL
jgi:pyridoxal phosphate enzyme (YggS family)